MQPAEAEKKIIDLLESFGDFLGIDPKKAISEDVLFDPAIGGPEGLDSLSAISLAVELEDLFGTTFQSEQFIGINMPSVLVSVIVRSLRSQGLINEVE